MPTDIDYEDCPHCEGFGYFAIADDTGQPVTSSAQTWSERRCRYCHNGFIPSKDQS